LVHHVDQIVNVNVWAPDFCLRTVDFKVLAGGGGFNLVPLAPFDGGGPLQDPFVKEDSVDPLNDYVHFHCDFL